MPNTLLIETAYNDQCFTLHHQLLEVSILMLLFAPWALIAISLMALHIVIASPMTLLACMAVVTASIPGLLHYISPAQLHQGSAR